MKTVLNLDDLYKISGFINENLYGDVPMTITMDVLTKERMREINKEFLKETGREYTPADEDLSEINVNVMNIKYKYKLVDHDNNTEEG